MTSPNLFPSESKLTAFNSPGWYLTLKMFLPFFLVFACLIFFWFKKSWTVSPIEYTSTLQVFSSSPSNDQEWRAIDIFQLETLCFIFKYLWGTTPISIGVFSNATFVYRASQVSSPIKSTLPDPAVIQPQLPSIIPSQWSLGTQLPTPTSPK